MADVQNVPILPIPPDRKNRQNQQHRQNRQNRQCDNVRGYDTTSLRANPRKARANSTSA